jgi:hypothetical protein
MGLGDRKSVGSVERYPDFNDVESGECQSSPIKGELYNENVEIGES